MNLLSDLKRTIPTFLVTIVLACVGLLPVAQAVVPAPGAAYPEGDTAKEQAAVAMERLSPNQKFLRI
jgi:hypothetical protein